MSTDANISEHLHKLIIIMPQDLAVIDLTDSEVSLLTLSLHSVIRCPFIVPPSLTFVSFLPPTRKVMVMKMTAV